MRASYPLQLEWLEGGMLDTVGRVLRGEPIYVRPTHSFVPFLYAPLYYYAGAAAAWVGGLGFSSLRILGTGCTVACFAIQFRMAARLAGSALAGTLAAGFFAALYAETGCWFDLARIDMLFTALLLAGVYCSWTRKPFSAALLFVLAFETKQSGLLVAVCVLAHEYGDTRRLSRGLGSFVLLAAAATWVLSRLGSPWYLYYTSYIPRHHALELRGVLEFFGRDLLYPSFFALAIVGLCVAATLRGPSRPATESGFPGTFLSAHARFLLFTTAGIAASCFLSRIHSGASINVALPLDAWLAILFGASVATLLRLRGIFVGAFQVRRGFVLALALLQFAALARSPWRYIPSPSAKREAAAELETIRQTPGRVYALDDAADLATIGKESFANGAAIFDVLRADRGPVAQALEQDVEQSFSRREYAAIVSAQPLGRGGNFPSNLTRFYRPMTTPLVSRPPDPDAFLADRTHVFPRYLSPAIQ